MKQFLQAVLALILMAGLLMPAGTAQALETIHVVTPLSTDWGFVDDNGAGNGITGFENGPDTPPLGEGSFYIELNSSTAGYIMATQKYQGTPLSDITTLSYSTYTNDSPRAMTFQINYDPDLTSATNPKPWYGRLAYEPYQNGTVTNNTWQTWDMIDGGMGKWWASPNGNSTVDDDCPQAAPCTLTDLLAAYPNIGIRNDVLSAIQFKAGSNWNGFYGNVDNFVIEIGGDIDIYDFEPLTTVYVDDDWIGTTPGDDPDGAGPATSFGIDSFATIQEAIDVIAIGGTVLVAAGDYEENLASWKDLEITKSLTLKGAGSGQTIVGLSEGKQNGVEIRGTNLDVHLEGITFTKRTGATNGPQRALRIGETASTFNSLTMTDVEVTHAALHNVALDGNATITFLTVTDSKFTDAGDSGFYSFAAINGGTFTDNVFDMNGRNDEYGGGLHLAGPTSNLIVTGGSMSNNAHVGFAGRRLTNVTFEDISANENGPGNPGLLGYQGYGMVINEKHSVSENVTFTNINMIDNRLDGMMLTAESGKEIKNISVIGGAYTGHVRYAIWYWNQTDGSISDVTIDGVTTSGNAPIRFHTISDINILNNTVGGGTGFGIDVRYASDVTVSGNDVTGRQAHAVIVQDTSEFEISDNIVHENDVVGIYLQDVTNGQVSGNGLFKNNQNEAHAGYANHPGNLVFRGNSENITVTSNVIRESKRNGIWIYNGLNSNISVNNNSISDNELYQIKNDDAFTVDATCNWWGTTEETVIDTLISGDVAYVPFLLNDDLNNPDCTGGLPYVVSITRTDASPTSALSVDFTVTFSEDVIDVDVDDFALTTTGVTGASITGVSGSDATYTVTVNTGSGNGTIRLDVPETASIADLSGNPLGDLPFTSGEVYTVQKNQTFGDVSFSHSAWEYIERLYNAGITGGCTTSPLNYCPNNSVNRAQMAIFLLRGIHGSAYTPPAATGTVFDDVPSNAFAAAWIEQLAAEGITGGCGGGNYCPNNSVTRSQMAIFLLRAKYGSSHTPPAATGTVFADIPSTAFAASWIEQLAGEGITGGCGGGNYCPDNPVTRAQMAIFLVRTFNLP
jgi:parallel beta-helix repeat protein